MSSRVKMEGAKERRSTGSFPEFGAIFMSSSFSIKACFENKIFGLPPSYAKFISNIKAGMILFLFEFEKRELHGVFQASCDGAMNIMPNAFGLGNLFPAQVKITHLWLCSPLSEHEFRDAIRENYFSAKKFSFGLSEEQVVRLLNLFSLRKIKDQGPERQLTSSQHAQLSSSSRSKARRVVHRDRLVSNRVTNEHNVDSKFNQAFSVVRQEDPVYSDRREIDDVQFGMHQNKEYKNKMERAMVRGTSAEYFGDYYYTTTRGDVDGGGLVSDRERYKWDVGADFRPVESTRYSVRESRSPSNVRFARSGSHESKSLLPVGYSAGNVRDAFPDVRIARSRHRFEEEYYKDNVFAPETSMERPNIFQTNFDSSSYSSKHVSNADSYAQIPARPSSTSIHAKEPQKNISYTATYGDPVDTNNHPYDPDVSCTRYSPYTLGVDQHSGSLQCAPDISHAGDILHSCRNQSRLSCPETANTSIYSDVNARARGRTLLPQLNQYEYYSTESLSRPATCDNPMIESSENASYDGNSYLMPPCSRNDGKTSELLTSCSFDSSYPHNPVPLEDHHEHKLSEFENTADYAADVPASYESQFHFGSHHFSQPKRADHLKEAQLSPLAYQDNESMDVGCQKKESVFSRLALAPRVSRREKNSSFGNNDHGVDSSVNEVMSLLYHSRYPWLKVSCESLVKRDPGATIRSKKPVLLNKSLKDPSAFSKESDSGATLRNKKQVMLNSKSLKDPSARSKETDSGATLWNTKQVMLNSKSLKDPSALSKENSDQKADSTPFVDFKCRSLVKKSLPDSRTKNSIKSGENDVLLGQRKRRKLVRPDFGMKGEACEPLRELSRLPEEVSSSHVNENKNSESAELLHGVSQIEQEDSHVKGNKESESAELLHGVTLTDQKGNCEISSLKGSSSEGVIVEGEARDILQKSLLESSNGATKVSPNHVNRSKITEYINMLRGTDFEGKNIVNEGIWSSEKASMDDDASVKLQRPSSESCLLRGTAREGKHMVDKGSLSSKNIGMDDDASGKLPRPSSESSLFERNINLLHTTDCEGKYMVDRVRLSSENISVAVDASRKLQRTSSESSILRNINFLRGTDPEDKYMVNSGRSSSKDITVDDKASEILQRPSSIVKRNINLLHGTDREGKHMIDSGSLSSENISMDDDASGKLQRPSSETSTLKRKTADFDASDSHVNVSNVCQSEELLDVGCQKAKSMGKLSNLEECEIGRDSDQDEKNSCEKDGDISFEELGAKVDEGFATAKDPTSDGLCEGNDNASHLVVQNPSPKVTRDTARSLHKRIKREKNR